jgi:hypothetical protein
LINLYPTQLMADLSLKALGKTHSPVRSRSGDWLFRALERVAIALAVAGLLLLSESWPPDLLRLAGFTVLALVAGLMVRAHLLTLHDDRATRQRSDRLIWATTLLAMLGVQVAHLSLNRQTPMAVEYFFVAPIVAQAMLVAAITRPGLAVVAMSVTVVTLGLSGTLANEVLLAAWLSGAVGAHVVNPLKQRSDLLRALGLQTTAQGAIAFAMALIAGVGLLGIQAALWSMAAALIATAIFWLGTVLIEKAFGITTDWTLLELGNPDHPLLRELVVRAPGTYAHSVVVGNLAEAAAREIGANPLLVRTMAYYHDIGKTVRPNYFIENQRGENAHDELSPSLSAQVIVSHVRDGVDLAKKAHLPQPIIDAIQEHHGTSLVTYFFHRAVMQGSTTACEEGEQRFRYDGPKPQSKETAVLHLADMVEAASRTLRADEDARELVTRLIENSRADGQLSESPLTFRDLERISDSFVRTLQAIRHDRVAYPTSLPTSAVVTPHGQ